MSIIDKIAEGYIQEAMEKGEFDNLSTVGKPLKLDDDSMVPRELRAGYRLLKNSGHLPPELGLIKEIRDVEALIGKASEMEQGPLNSRLRRLQMRLDGMREGMSGVVQEDAYRRKLQRKFQS
jgi:hypothetical protein